MYRRIALWSLPAIIGTLHAATGTLTSRGEPMAFIMPLLWNVPIWYYWALMLPLIQRMVRRYPLTSSTWRASIWRHLGAAIPMAAVASVVITAAPLVLGSRSVEDAVNGYFGALNMRLLFDIVTYAAITLGLTAMSLWREVHERELRSAHLETELANARLHALRSQLKPHFLFNSLNTIAMLMRIGQTQDALQLLTRYGRLLRTTIESDQKEWPLSEEISFLKRYLDLEQARFSDRLSVAIDLDDCASQAIVPTFILQPLVENAIGHGLRHVEQNALLHIRAECAGPNVRIRITDNGSGLPKGWSIEEDAGVGLTNTMSQLAHTFGNTHRFAIENANPGVVVSVEIPMRVSDSQPSAD